MSILEQAARVGANALPVYRSYRGLRVAHELGGIMRRPIDRTWKFAGRVAADAATDKIDGTLARFAGTTRIGGYLDQTADKLWYLSIVRQLVKNQELEPVHFWLPLGRDAGVSVLRPLAQSFGLETDAKTLGKLKMGIQAAAVVSACSPLAEEQPEFVNGLFDAATMASAASGIDMLQGYLADIGTRYPNEPAAQLIAASTVAIRPLE